MTALYIDADACPVKAEAERVATRHEWRMFVVSNGGLRPSQNPLVENVIVDAGADVADMWIAERCGPGDVVVTGDIPLAAKCIEAGATGICIRWVQLGTVSPKKKLATLDLAVSIVPVILTVA